jgi:hypothetical protein
MSCAREKRGKGRGKKGEEKREKKKKGKMGGLYPTHHPIWLNLGSFFFFTHSHHEHREEVTRW